MVADGVLAMGGAQGWENLSEITPAVLDAAGSVVTASAVGLAPNLLPGRIGLSSLLEPLNCSSMPGIPHQENRGSPESGHLA